MTEPTTSDAAVPAALSDGRNDVPLEDSGLLGQLQSLVQVMLRHKLLILFVITLGTAAGYVWLTRQVPIHRAVAKVMIDVQAPKVLSNVNEVVELGSRSYFGPNVLYFESQYQIIRGHEVAEKVLDRLGLWNSEHLLGLDRPGLELTPDEKLEKMAEAHYPKVLASRIELAPVKNSMMVAIEFEDSDPDFAVEVVNAVAEAYRDQNLEYKKKVVRDATQELKRLMEDWEERFGEAEEAVRAFEVQHNVGTIPNTQKANDDRLTTLSAKLNEVRVERIELEARSKALAGYRKVKDIWEVKALDLLENDLIRNLKQEMATREAKLASLGARYLEKHPDVEAIRNELGALEKTLRTEVRNFAVSAEKELQRAVDVEEGVRAEIDAAKREERVLADIDRDYARLVEVREQYRKQAEDIRKRYIETTMTAQVETNNVRVLEPAVEALKVRPRRAVVMSITLLLSILLALVVAFAMEFGDSTIKDWQDLSERLGRKVLGVLPVISDEDMPRQRPGDAPARGRDLFVHEHPRSQVAEAFRALRTNVLFMATARPIKSLLITSANPSEGKTTVATCTAISMAFSGTKVLLVEADMRRPRLARTFDLLEDVGLTACLAGNAPISEHVQKTVVENLDVLVCGPIPPNPAELLHTQRFRDLKAEMESTYDLVVFDSPPVNPVADALVLGRQVDGALLVVRALKTSRHALRHAYRQLAGVGVVILGTVLNHREAPRRAFGSTDGYYRGYGYGKYTYVYAQPYGPADGESSS